MSTTHTENRHSDPATWPEQLFLPGQVAAPPGPVDMAMMYVMHHAFRRDLAKFADAARETPVDDQATWQALAERWAIFATALHHHHAGEDAGIWPYLLERANDEERATLEAMEEEHSEIDPLLEGSAAGLERLSQVADVEAKAALAARLVAAKESLGRHLAHEETEAIVILQRYMTDADWQRLEKEHFQGDRDLRFMLAVVPWIAYDAPRDRLQRVLDEAGLPIKVLLALTSRGFERRERKAFRYVTG